MRLILLVLACLVGLVSADMAQFTKYCRRESKLKRDFDALALDDPKRRSIWMLFLGNRGDRIVLGHELSLQDCSQVAQGDSQIMVITDEQVFEQLCRDEARLGVELTSSTTKTVRKALGRLHEEAQKQRRKFGEQNLKNQSCPEFEVNSKESGSLASRLEESFKANCEQEVFNDYLEQKVQHLRSKYGASELQGLEMVAGVKRAQAARERMRLCDGLVVQCCDEALVEDVRRKAPVKAAQMILKVVDEWIEAPGKKFQGDREGGQWDKAFVQLCQLEHKTGNVEDFYKGRPLTKKVLNRFHNIAQKYRLELGALLERNECPSEAIQSLKPLEDKGKYIRVHSRCEKEVKSELTCQKFTEAKKDTSERVIHDLALGWCDKYHELKKVSSGQSWQSKCNDEMRTLLTEEVEVETEVTLEAVRLRKIVQEAGSLKASIDVRKDDAYSLLRQVKESLKKEYKEQVDLLRKEHSRLAYQLVKDRCEELKSASGGSKFKLWNPSTW